MLLDDIHSGKGFLLGWLKELENLERNLEIIRHKSSPCEKPFFTFFFLLLSLSLFAASRHPRNIGRIREIRFRYRKTN
jgi:hypothetical protein